LYLCNYNSDFKELEPLFEVDPLLLRLFVRKLEVAAGVSFLFGKVPTSIVIMRLAEECLLGREVMFVHAYHSIVGLNSTL